MVNRIPLEIVLLGSRRTPLHRTKALSSSESTVAIRVPQFEHFLGKTLRPGQGGDFFQLAKLVETLRCQGNGRRIPTGRKGSVHANIDLPRPQPSGVTLSERLTRKERDKLPALGAQERPQSLETTKSQQFRNIVLAAGPVSVKSITHRASTLGALNAAV